MRKFLDSRIFPKLNPGLEPPIRLLDLSHRDAGAPVLGNRAMKALSCSLLLLGYAYFTSPTWAQEKTVESFPQMAEPYLALWVDTDPGSTFAQAEQASFVPSGTQQLNFGYSHAVVWLKLQIRNTSQETIHRFFEIELDTISRFDFFRAGQADPVYFGGLERPRDPKDQHRHPTLEFKLAPGELGIWYIRLQNNYSINVIAWLHDAESMASKETREALVFGVYAGLILFALLLSCYMFLSTLHRSFVVFAFMLLSFHLGFQFTNFGLTWIHLWPQSIWWANRATFFFIELSNIAGLIFVKETLQLHRNLPRLNRFLWVIGGKSVLLILWSLFDFSPSLVSLTIHSTGLMMLFYYSLGIFLWHKDYSPAKYLSIAWLTVIVFNFASILQAVGFIQIENTWLRSALRFDLMLISCSIQAIFLAIAIGNQFEQVQREKESEKTARKKLEQNLDDAHAVQDAFIRENVQSHSFEIVTSHHPSAKIGGDWLGYYHDRDHNRLLLAISDVTGHGLPAALLTGAIHGAFYGLSSHQELDRLPSEQLLSLLMHRINEVVCMTALNTSLLATMVMVAVDLATGRIDYINAGHTPVMLIRANGSDYILHGGSPLGLKRDPNFGIGHSHGASGETLFLYTDGLLENAKTAKRLQLHHLSQILAYDESPQTLKNRLEQLVSRGAATLEDDYSYIICRLRSA